MGSLELLQFKLMSSLNAYGNICNRKELGPNSAKNANTIEEHIVKLITDINALSTPTSTLPSPILRNN